jgi:hypothetical protein
MVVLRVQGLETFGELWYTALKHIPHHEYHISKAKVSLFHVPAIQIWKMRENSSEGKKLTKYR